MSPQPNLEELTGILVRAVLDPSRTTEVLGRPEQNQGHIDFISSLLSVLQDSAVHDQSPINDLRSELENNTKTERPSRQQVGAAYSAVLYALAELEQTELIENILNSRDYFRSLELLDMFIDQVEERKASKPDVDIIVCRHLFGSTVPELCALDKLANSNRKIAFGKPYSGNIAAALQLRQYGWEVSIESLNPPDLALFGAYERLHRRLMTQYLIDHVFSDRDFALASEPILILDDGGSLVQSVHEAQQMTGARRPILAVEQTTRGLNNLKSLLSSTQGSGTPLAAISIANTNAKILR